MVAPKGNRYWQLAEKMGRPKKYSPSSLWGKAIEYFEWVNKNPLKEDKVFANGKRMQVSKIRAMTIRAFCLFANMGESTFNDYNGQQEFSVIIARIKDVIYTQKFEGAAAGLLESNIIARELGLADKQNVEMASRDITNSPLNGLSTEKLLRIEQILDED